jgi:alkylhydroperoxidase family enzyme
MLPQKIKPRFFDTLSNMTGRYVKPAPYHKATGLTEKIYEQVVDEFFINGPLTTHAVCPPVLAGVWMAEREIMLTDQQLTREDKEALGVTFSQVNGCSYCEDLINSVVYGAEETALAEQLRHRNQCEIKDAKNRKLHEWALSSYDIGTSILRNPPFGKAEAPEIIGSAFMFNYFNRYVRVFFSGTPLKAPFSSKTIKTALYRLTGIELYDSVIRRLDPGRSLEFLPPSELPDDMKWAEPNQFIAAAISRWAEVLNEAAARNISRAVRDRVEDEVSRWRGEPMGLSRAWLNPMVDGLDDTDTATARLALLTALSPSQMSDEVINTFRTHHSEDEALVITVAWAAFTASRRIAGWLADQSGHFREKPSTIAA